MSVAGPDGLASAPLNASRLRAALGGRAGSRSFWSEIRVVAETGSTNADALASAMKGAPEGLLIAAERQVAGRGRLGRNWVSLRDGALTFSVLLRPRPVPQAALGWVPLLTGVAVVTALRSMTAVDAQLKWPNDVLVGAGKLGGILAERGGEAIVVGVGINVSGSEREMPVRTATSLALHGAGKTDRTGLLAEILSQLERLYKAWRQTGSGDAEGCGLRREYLRYSATVGRSVEVKLPGGQSLRGVATDVDPSGRLLVCPDRSVGERDTSGPEAVSGHQADQGGQLVAVSAGDVIHVRPAL